MRAAAAKPTASSKLSEQPACSVVAGVLVRSERLRVGLRKRSINALPRRLRRGERAFWLDPEGHAAFHSSDAPIGVDGHTMFVAADDRARCALESLRPGIARDWPSCLGDVRGGFALALWDAERRALTLARDLFGQRQIYFSEDADGLWFSTELDDLLLTRPRRPSLHVASAVSYLLRGMPLVGRTLAAEVRSVPAAHVYRFDGARGFGQCIRYWTPLRPVLRHRGRGNMARALRAAFESAVHASVGRPPLAILLSGGIDSSLVAYLAASRKALPPCGFTIDCDDGESDDVHYARMVAQAIGARHVVVQLGAADAAALLGGVLGAPAPASAWTAITHSRLLAAISVQGFGSVLSGMGADELFGGYDRMLDHYYRHRSFSRSWRGAGDWFTALLQQQRAREVLFPGIASFFQVGELNEHLSSRELPTQLAEDVAFYSECRAIAPEAAPFTMMMAHEVQARIPDLLMQGFEPIARQFGLSFIYPFLDPAMTPVAAGLTPDELYWFEHGAFWAKRTLRRMATGIVPSPIVMRPRTAYDAPIARWMGERIFSAQVIERLAGTRLWQSGLFRRGARAALLREARALARGEAMSVGDACSHVWIVLTLGAWYDQFVECA